MNEETEAEGNETPFLIKELGSSQMECEHIQSGSRVHAFIQ